MGCIPVGRDPPQFLLGKPTSDPAAQDNCHLPPNLEDWQAASLELGFLSAQTRSLPLLSTLGPLDPLGGVCLVAPELPEWLVPAGWEGADVVLRDCPLRAPPQGSPPSLVPLPMQLSGGGGSSAGS